MLSSSPVLKGILVFKIIILISFALISMDIIKIGDLNLNAQEGSKDKNEATDNKDDTKSENKKDEASTEQEEKKRPSYLDNLINLPKLDAKSLKKEEIARYLDIAERKEKQIDTRLETLKTREKNLIDIEASIDKKLLKLEDEKKFVLSTIQKEKDLKDERVNNLIAIYKKMDPKKAAPLFEKMDKDLAVAMFKQIPEKQLTAIMMKMTPEKSVELTEYYGRVKSLKEYDLLKEMNESMRKEFDACKGMPEETKKAE